MEYFNIIKKLILDIFSMMSLFWALVGGFIWAHYYPDNNAPNGDLILNLSLVNLPIAVFSLVWLVFRYPLVSSKISRVSLCIPLLYLVGYFILKNTIWR